MSIRHVIAGEKLTETSDGSVSVCTGAPGARKGSITCYLLFDTIISGLKKIIGLDENKTLQYLLWPHQFFLL